MEQYISRVAALTAVSFRPPASTRRRRHHSALEMDVPSGALSASSNQVATNDEQGDDYDHDLVADACDMEEEIEVVYQEMEDTDQ
jgi:hypothetical protein